MQFNTHTHTHTHTQRERERERERERDGCFTFSVLWLSVFYASSSPSAGSRSVNMEFPGHTHMLVIFCIFAVIMTAN